MAKGPAYNLAYKRRQEGRTDYEKRKALVVSRLPRLVVRASSKNFLVQVSNAKSHGDFVLACAHSSELKEFDWRLPRGNVPAAYLTGLLAGLRAKKAGVTKAVLDIGLRGKTVGSRVFAALKGAVDAGLHVPHSGEVVPKEERLKGTHIVYYAKALASDDEAFRKQFSACIKAKLRPEETPSYFDRTFALIREKEG